MGESAVHLCQLVEHARGHSSGVGAEKVLLCFRSLPVVAVSAQEGRGGEGREDRMRLKPELRQQWSGQTGGERGILGHCRACGGASKHVEESPRRVGAPKSM